MPFQFNHKVKLSLIITTVIYLLAPWQPIHAEDSPNIREYQVKAIFLLRFSKFVTYPENVFSSSDSPINICVLGDEPFQGTLDTLVKDEKVQKRVFKVNYLRTLEKVSDCHTLFISSSEQKQLVNILARVKQHAILTVSDIEDFINRGGMIQFYIMDNKVRFLIDQNAVKDANLTMSSRVLTLGKPVKNP